MLSLSRRLFLVETHVIKIMCSVGEILFEILIVLQFYFYFYFYFFLLKADGRKHQVPVVDRVTHCVPWNAELDLNDYYTEIDKKYY